MKTKTETSIRHSLPEARNRKKRSDIGIYPRKPEKTVEKILKEIPDFQTILVAMKLVDKKIKCADELGLIYHEEGLGHRQEELLKFYHLSSLLA